MTETTTQAFFESKYRLDQDPWRFASSSYEAGRYAATVEALGCRHFVRAIEPGCSIGVLTQKLAAISDWVEAFDISATAIERARCRCGHLPNVQLDVSSLDSHVVAVDFDLLVLSEIGYYFAELEFTFIAKRIVEKLARDGVLLAVHWLGHSPDHVLSGDRVHELLFSLPGLKHEYAERHKGFRLDRWRRI